MDVSESIRELEERAKQVTNASILQLPWCLPTKHPCLMICVTLSGRDICVALAASEGHVLAADTCAKAASGATSQ